MNKLALTLLFTATPFFAADEALPKAETILDRYVEATGGKAAYQKRTNTVTHGSMVFAAQGLKGEITIYQAAPNKSYSVIDLAGVGKIESGSNGEVAWESSALQGPRVKQGTEKTDALRDATFNSTVNWRDVYAKAETAGSETVGEHECYKVVLTPKAGSPTAEFFDKKTGLMVKSTATRTTPMGEISAEVFFDDFKKEGDVLAPHKMTQKFAGQELEIVVQSVETNVDMPKGRFDLPAEIQDLLKKAEPAPKPAPQPQAATSNNGGKLTVYRAGTQMASETYTVDKADGKIAVSGSGNAAIGPMKIDIEQFKVVTDDKYQLLEAVAKAKMGQITMNVKTTFADGKAKNEVDTGQGPKTKEDAVHADAVVVNANLPLYPWSFLAMRADLKSKDPQEFPVYVLNQAEVKATVLSKGRETVEFAGGKTAELNHLEVNGSTPQGQPIKLDFWVDDNRKVIKIAVPSEGVEAYQQGFDPKPQPPKPEAPKGESKGA